MLQAGDWVSIPGRGREEIFFFTTSSSRLALTSTHPPTQWVLGVLSLSVEQLGCQGLVYDELYLHSPHMAWCSIKQQIHPHGKVVS